MQKQIFDIFGKEKPTEQELEMVLKNA